MKRINNIYSSLYNYDNVLKVYKSVRKTCKNKKELFEFELNLNSNIINICTLLRKKEYVFNKYRIFLIKEPKFRLIMSECISDKIVNHLVCKYILPLEKCLIDNNVSTRANRGSKLAFNYLVRYINDLSLNGKVYCLKIDIKKYFYNIDHYILKELLHKRVKDIDALNILFNIIDSTNSLYINEEIIKLKDKYAKNNKIINEINSIPQYEYGKGLGIGNMTSQFFGIFYLNELDHYIKETLHIKCYIRYMDDMILLSNDKCKLNDSLFKIRDYLKGLKLVDNKKTKLYCLNDSINFLGYNFKYKDKLIIKCCNKSYNRIDKYLSYIHSCNYPLYYKSIRSYKGYFIKSNIKNKLIIKENCMLDKYNNIKKDYKEYIVLIKKGNFYYTYDEDTLLMWYFFNYKIINSKVGFPISAYNKVKVVLMKNSINTIILSGNDIISIKYENNFYLNALGLAYDKSELEYYKKVVCERVNKIIESDINKYDLICEYLDSL